MASTQQTIDFVVNGKGNAAEYFEKIQAKLKKMREEEEKTRGSWISNLKKQFGEESAMGNISKMLTGAGAVAGLAVASRVLGDAATKMVDLRNQLNAGTLGAAEFADQLARSIPILGNLYTAGRAIRELITGEEELTQAIKDGADARDRAAKTMESQLRLQRELRDLIQQEGAKIPTMLQRSALSPFTGAFDAFMGGVGKSNAIGKSFQETMDKLQPDRDRLIALRKDLTQVLGAVEPVRDQWVSAGVGAAPVKVGTAGGPTAAQRERIDAINAEMKAIEGKIAKVTADAEELRMVRGTNNLGMTTAALTTATIMDAVRGVTQAAQNPTSPLGQLWGNITGFAGAIGGMGAGGKTPQQRLQDDLRDYADLTREMESHAQDLMSYQDQERKLQDQLAELMRPADPRFSGGLAATMGSRYLTGVAAASSENNPLNKIVPINQKQLDVLQQIRDIQEKILDTQRILESYDGV